MADVGAQERLGAGPVPVAEQPDELMVLLGGVDELALLGKTGDAVEAGALAQRGRELRELRIVGEGEHLGVELPVVGEVGGEVLLGGTAGARIGDAHELGEGLLGDVRGHRVHDRGFNEEADLGEVVEVLLRHRRDPESLVLHGLDETLAGEVHHRLADRGRRDPELFAEDRCGDKLPFGELTGDDGRSQAVEHGLAQVLGTVEAGEGGHGGFLSWAAYEDTHSRNPAGKGSLGSRTYCAVPVTHARPWTVGTTAGRPATVVSATRRPTNREPM